MLFVYILVGLMILCLLISYYCYRTAFYSPKRKPKDDNRIEIPEGDIYEVYRDAMENWVREVRALPHEDIE